MAAEMPSAPDINFAAVRRHAAGSVAKKKKKNRSVAALSTC